MKGRVIKITALLFLVAAALAATFLLQDDYLSLHNVKQHKEQLLSFIRTHYIQAMLSFIGLYIGAAFFLPGALALTIAGGMMFGTVPAVIYANIGATTGAVLAFFAARSIFGGWMQEKFKEQLKRFNREVSRHGHNYLLVLRILPIAPFFAVNYCAGLTKVPLKTFIWTTSIGMLPGSLIYSFIGEQLRYINAPSDVFSWKIVLALLLLSLFALMPVILHHLQRRKY
jgi:uncharacterized membrane protein YdjX (TVP38/TMEM64 family)